LCLIIFAFEHHPEYRLILAANRDEFYDRPTRQLAYWKDCQQLIAGRDEKAGGTWLAVAHGSRLAAITNYRDPARVRADAPSRGDLVRNFVAGDFTPRTYAARIQPRAHRYNGFNLLLYDGRDLVYYGNRHDRIIALEQGIYGLSNHLLDTPWPKVTRAKALLAPMLSGQSPLESRAALKLLGDRHQPADEQLPDTGVGITWERILAPIFITSPTYGTRSSSLVCVGRNGRTAFSERTYTPNHSPKSNYSDRHFTLTR
jgi:uncharacterized protein with NRDE domain